MRISTRQAAAVSALAGPKRYSHFVKVVANTEVAWGLWQDGWALASTDEGERAFPLWPAQLYAEACATDDWQGYEAREIPLAVLLDELLPDLEHDGIRPAVFMTKDSKGTTPAVEVLVHDLRLELTQYG